MYQIVKSKEEDGVRYCLSYNEIKSENNAEIKYIQMKVNSVNCRGDVTSQNYETVHLELIKKGKFVNVLKLILFYIVQFYFPFPKKNLTFVIIII